MTIIGMIVDNDFNKDMRVRNEAFALANAGFSIKILCCTKKVQIPHKNIQIIPAKIPELIKNRFRPLVNSFPLYFWIWRFKINNFLKYYNIRILHIHDLYMAVPSLKSKFAANTHLVLDLHENFPAAISNYKWANSFFRFLIRPEKWLIMERQLLESADSIVALSDFYKKQLLSKYSLSADNILVYPNVPDTGQLLNYPLDANLPYKIDSFTILYFGVIAERRGLDIIFNSIPILKSQIPNFRFLLIGPIDNADKEIFYKQINSEEIKEHVTYVGFQEMEKFPSWIKISDICISPIKKNDQHDIGVANKVFQYMLFGKPVVVSDSLSQKLLTETENCGLVFRHNSTEDFANKVLELFKNPELRQQLGANGKSAVLTKYNLSVYSEVLINHYKKIETDFEVR